LSFYQGKDEIVYISHLGQSQSDGSIILNTFGTDGDFRSQTISRLPLEIAHCVNITLVNAPVGENSDVVKVVLNKASQKRYTPMDVSKLSLPTVIERQKKSIPCIKGTLQIPLGYTTHSNDFNAASMLLQGGEKAEVG
jgi:hypothetical protein